MAISITVKAESRAAKSGRAYNDQIQHGYNPNYVNPQTRRIKLTSGKLPPNTRSWESRVTRRSDGRLFSKAKEVSATEVNPRASIGFNLPTEGIYDCQLIVTLEDGKQQKSPIKSINLRDLLVVIIGDSAASGEGNPDEPGQLNIPTKIKSFVDLPAAAVDAIKDGLSRIAVEHLTTLIAGGQIEPPSMDKEPRWLEKNAHRSLRAGHVLAAKRLEDLNKGTVVTLLTFARSGAEVMLGLLGPRDDENRGKNDSSWINGNGQIGQLEEVRKTVGQRPIDALIISIGGNDLGFAGGVRNMLTGDTPWDFFNHKDDKKARTRINQEVDRLLGPNLESGELTKSGGHFDQLKAQIDKLNVNNVFLIGYPTSFFDDRNGNVQGGCEVLESFAWMDLSKADAQLFKDIAQHLNETLSTIIASRYGWRYVDVAAEFVGHGYCSKSGRFFIHCEESLKNQGDIDGILHPNAAGHKIYEECIYQAMHRRLILLSLPISQQPVGVAIFPSVSTSTEIE